MKKNYQKRLTVTIRPQLDKKLRDYCRETGRSMSYVVDEGVERFIKEQKGDKNCKYLGGFYNEWPKRKEYIMGVDTGTAGGDWSATTPPPIKGETIEDEPLDPMRPQ